MMDHSAEQLHGRKLIYKKIIANLPKDMHVSVQQQEVPPYRVKVIDGLLSEGIVIMF